MRTDRLTRRLHVACALFALILLVRPPAAGAQYVVESPLGDSLVFEAAELRVMLDTARALYTDLQEDPRVLYITPVARRPATEDDPEPAYPWNVVTVQTDSTVDLLGLPANLREADRAYYNYSVMRMRVVRSADPDVPCDSVLALEENVVGSFIDGWVLSRTLFGGPAFAPLDELAFARQAGHLRTLLAVKNDRQVGACAAEWAEANPDRVVAYQTWRRERFPRPGEDVEEVVEEELEDPGEAPGSPVEPTEPSDGR